MKILAIMFVLLLVFNSCTNNSEESTINDFEGKWILGKMTGGTANSETTGAEMEWQEFYVLNKNGTFIKSRNRDGVITEISGTYSISNLADGDFLHLIYRSENDIIGSCLSNTEENLRLKSKYTMASMWLQCDGPGLEYGKVLPVD